MALVVAGVCAEIARWKERSYASTWIFGELILLTHFH